MGDIQETLLPVFIEETELALSQIEAFIQDFKDESVTQKSFEDARRAAHTIKGTAGLVKRFQTSDIARELENHLDAHLNSKDPDLDKVSEWHKSLCHYLDLAKNGQHEDSIEEESQPEDALDSLINVTDQDIINDFALPFMMKLHDAGNEAQELVKPVCCRFFVSGRQYFISVKEVLEIYQYSDITPLPFAPAYIPGLLNIRGMVVPVVDLARLEGGERVGGGAAPYAVIAGTDKGIVGFMTDTVPNLSVKNAGHHIDVATFIEQNKVQA
jgi:chemotaxis signal transduction protein/HPt (histidine-containing phosphotransfer) domain-containing protein